MKTSSLKIHLGVWFILAVVLPSLLLGFLAIRTVAHEEAFLEKRLQDTLTAETDHAAVVIAAQMKTIQQELDRVIFLDDQTSDLERQTNLWMSSSDLAGTPFVLSQQHEFLIPSTTKGFSSKENSFVRWSSDFFKDIEPTPVYENIAIAYKDTINQKSSSYQSENLNDRYDDSKNSWSSSLKKISSLKRSRESDAVGDQYAVSQFQQYQPAYQQSIYQEAADTGKTIVNRNVVQQRTQAPSTTEQSIFIGESQRFSQIIAKDTSGIIPFIIKEKLRLLFWKKTANGYILGCLIDDDALINRVVAALPPIYSETRIITVLDENGKPIITPDQKNQMDWKRPFVAAEISGLLPRWEVAAYLTDPQAVSSKARATEFLTWLLILILLVSIITGGTLVLRSLNSEIRLAQQKASFAATVSHELKTPLTSIRMLTEMLREGRQPDENKRRQYFDIMLSESERLTRLINNVLDFSLMGRKQKTYHFQEIDIVHVCQSAFEGQRVRLEYNGFETSFASAVIGIKANADEEAIKQVLLNLLSNAEKYTADTKRIDIEIVKKDNWVVINVMDRGVGVAPDKAKRIFEEFYRVDDSLTAKTRGTGLGLTIALNIMRDHKGDITYLPRDGGGSIFQIKLPCVIA